MINLLKEMEEMKNVPRKKLIKNLASQLFVASHSVEKREKERTVDFERVELKGGDTF